MKATAGEGRLPGTPISLGTPRTPPPQAKLKLARPSYILRYELKTPYIRRTIPRYFLNRIGVLRNSPHISKRIRAQGTILTPRKKSSSSRVSDPKASLSRLTRPTEAESFHCVEAQYLNIAWIGRTSGASPATAGTTSQSMTTTTNKSFQVVAFPFSRICHATSQLLCSLHELAFF